MFLVPKTIAFSFFRYLHIVKCTCWFSLSRIVGSNLVYKSPLSEKSNRNDPSSSLKYTSVWVGCAPVENRCFKKLTVAYTYSSSLGFTKSTRAFKWTSLIDRYRLFGSSVYCLLVWASLACNVEGVLASSLFASYWCCLCACISRGVALALPPFCSWIGRVLMMSVRIPSLLIFSSIWFLSTVASRGSFATASRSWSKNFDFSKCWEIAALTESSCEFEICCYIFISSN